MFIGVYEHGSRMSLRPRRGGMMDTTISEHTDQSGQLGVPPSPWLTVKEAAARARCGVKTVYREVRAGRLRAARVGGRRELRFLTEWVDEWLIAHCTVQEWSCPTPRKEKLCQNIATVGSASAVGARAQSGRNVPTGGISTSAGRE